MSVSPIYSFPESVKIQAFERERLPILANNYAGNELFPVTDWDSANIDWEIRDDIDGMTYLIGVGENFPVGDDTGITRFTTPAGRFGEARQLDPEVITRGRRMDQTSGMVDPTAPIDVAAEMGVKQEEMAVKEQVLIEYLRWQLLTTGVASAAKKDGTTSVVARFTPQIYTPTIPFDQLTNAAPFAEFENVRTTYSGNGHDFGSKAVAIGNARTIDTIVNNANTADLGSRRAEYGQTLNSMKIINDIFMGQNIPQLRINDETYKLNGVPQRYLPDGYIVVVGYRQGTGLKVGNYLMTRNENNPGGAPGLYAASGVAERAPRVPWTERGHNGGLRQTYRRQVVVLRAFSNWPNS